MSDYEDFFKDRMAAINAEFDQLREVMREISLVVSDYRASLKKSKQFTDEESFMLTMECQSFFLGAVFAMNLGQEPDGDDDFSSEVPDFPPEDL
jgi:hypothetical protein